MLANGSVFGSAKTNFFVVLDETLLKKPFQRSAVQRKVTYFIYSNFHIFVYVPLRDTFVRKLSFIDVYISGIIAGNPVSALNTVTYNRSVHFRNFLCM